MRASRGGPSRAAGDVAAMMLPGAAPDQSHTAGTWPAFSAEPGRRIELLSPDYKAGALPLSYPGLITKPSWPKACPIWNKNATLAGPPLVPGVEPAPKLGSLIASFSGGRVSRMALRDRDRAVLDVERGWWLEGRSKSEVVRARLRMSLSRYNQLLGELLANEDAEAYDPLVVRRLRRARERRRFAMMGVSPAGGRRGK
jgi:hypothetical protein